MQLEARACRLFQQLLSPVHPCVVIGPALPRLRMTQSVSFRITRTAEDVAVMLNALSQRLVKLEQRLESLELQVRQQRSESASMPAEERERLDVVDQMLQDCQELLNSSEFSPEATCEPLPMVSQDSAAESEHEAAAA